MGRYHRPRSVLVYTCTRTPVRGVHTPPYYYRGCTLYAWLFVVSWRTGGRDDGRTEECSSSGALEALEGG